MRRSNPQAEKDSDIDLLLRMSTGEERAFTALYRRYQGVLYRFALQMSGSAATAEEVTQEVFMWLMSGSGEYRAERGPLLTFLYGVTRNYVLRHLARERVYSIGIDEPDANMTEPVKDATILDDLEQDERVELLRQAILKLPAPYREVVVLCDLHELDYAETASILGCPVGTVRSRLHRARTLLSWKMRAAEECPA